jgi:dihydropteroate synthase
VRWPADGSDRCVVMGILNVTPDSFSDGGRFVGRDDAVTHGLAMRAQGADLVDVGGESTRPGASRVTAEQEAARVIPVLRELVAAGVGCSIDTTRAEVAEQALEAGAVLVNDVSGGLGDPSMGKLVAEAGVPWVLMHWRGPSDRMQELAHYDDVVAEVRTELLARVDAALGAGVDASQLIIDPGLGFAKHPEHNWPLLRRLDALIELGYPVLVGASRKRFLGTLLPDAAGEPRPPAGREAATVAISALAAAAGVWGVRVHDVPVSMDAVTVAGAWRRGEPPERTASPERAL